MDNLPRQALRDELRRETADSLHQRRAKLVAIVDELARTHDVDRMGTEELDLWIERLRPIRLEVHEIDMALREISPVQQTMEDSRS